MVVVNAILYSTSEENFPYSFGITAFELSQPQVGIDEEQAISNLEAAIEALVDHARSDPNTNLTLPLDPIARAGMEKIIVENRFTPIINKRLEDAFGITLHIYDLTKENFFPQEIYPRERLPMIYPDKFVEAPA